MMNAMQTTISQMYINSICKKATDLGYDYLAADEQEKVRILAEVEKAWQEPGIKAQKEERAEKERVLLAEKKRAFERYKESIPRVFKEANVKHFREGSPLVQHILNGGSALIIGGTGVGKTHLAYACSKELAYMRADADSVKVTDMSRMLSDVKANGGDWLRDITERYGKVTTLFIDEYDKMFGSQADYQLVSHLINIRWEEGLQTVVLGNGTEELAKNLLGAAAISRLVGRSTGGAFFDVGGADRRRA